MNWYIVKGDKTINFSLVSGKDRGEKTSNKIMPTESVKSNQVNIPLLPKMADQMKLLDAINSICANLRRFTTL